MPRKPSAEQQQRSEIRRIRGSVARLDKLLQTQNLTPAELIAAERELRRVSNALLRAERRGQVGRPKSANSFDDPPVAPVRLTLGSTKPPTDATSTATSNDGGNDAAHAILAFPFSHPQGDLGENPGYLESHHPSPALK